MGVIDALPSNKGDGRGSAGDDSSAGETIGAATAGGAAASRAGAKSPSSSSVMEGDKHFDRYAAEEVPLYKKLSYGSVSFATLSLSLLVNAYGTDYYVQMGALLPVISLFTALARSFDIVTDLFMGWFSDNARTPYGRRRPFMAIGCIPYGFFFFMFFYPPVGLGQLGISLYFGAFYILFYLSDTVASVPYEALGPELSHNYEERNTIFFIARLFQVIGSVTASIAPAILQTAFNRSGFDAAASARMSFMITAMFFGLWYIGSTLVCTYLIQERPPLGDDADMKNIPLVPSILRSFRNPAIRSLILAWVMDGLQLAVLVTLFPFYIRYYIRPNGPVAASHGITFLPTSFIGINITILFLSAALSTPLWLVLARRFGKYEAWIAYNILSTGTNLLLLLPSEGQNVLVMVVLFLNGIPNGGGFLNKSIMADVIDYEELLNGVRSEGTFSVYATLVNKTVAIPGSAIPLGILGIIGFVYPIGGVDQAQPQAVNNFLYYGLSLFTCLCSVVGVWAKTRFPLKKPAMLFDIHEGVQQLAAGGSALDPITQRTIRRPELTDEEREIRWLLENFGPKTMRSIFDRKDATWLARQMLYWMMGSICMSALLLVATVYSLLYLIGVPELSIIATMTVIATSFSLCWTYVCVSGYVDARKLLHVELPKLTQLIKKLMDSSNCSSVSHTA